MTMLSRLLGTDTSGVAIHDGDLTIEPMRRRDLRAVMPIESAAYPTSWSRRVFESELEQMRDGDRYYVVAKLGPTIVGYGGLWFVDDPDGEQAHLTNIVVDEHHRRSGIATRVLVALARIARERGCVAWTLEVRAHDAGARALYQRFGFAPVGVRKRYYDNIDDAVVMWCHGLGSDEYGDRLDQLEHAARSSTSAEEPT